MNIIESFKGLPTKQRVLAIISIFIALTVIVLGFLQLFDVFEWAPCIYLPLMSVSMLIQAYNAHEADAKANRGTVILSLVAAGVVLLCGIGVIIIKLTTGQ